MKKGQKKPRGRKKPVNKVLIEWYRELLCLKEETTFVLRCRAYQRQTYGKGPNEKTIRVTLDSGEASGRIYDTILRTLQGEWRNAVEKGDISEEKVPMPVSLTEWPVGLSDVARMLAEQQARAKGKPLDGQVGTVREIGARSAKSRDSSVLTAEDCAAEISQIIRDSERAYTLYACIENGRMMVDVLKRVDNHMAKVDKIVVRSLASDYLDKLEQLGLVESRLSEYLGYSVHMIGSAFAGNHGVPVVFEHWKGMAPMQGMMYAGEEILYWGPWQFSYGILTTTYSPMFRLTAEDGERFRVCKAILKRGDSIGEEGMKMFWDQGKMLWG